MPQVFDELHYRVGDASVLDNMTTVMPLPPFSAGVLGFLQTFSRCLLRDLEAREYSDVISLAFWCRKASLEKMKQPYGSQHLLLGRGVAFHISPSNVAVNFAYSLVVGLLTGNANIVRLPSKYFVQVDIICRVLTSALLEHVAIRSMICLVEYGHQQHINNALSSLCHARLIWGGDKTIALLRQAKLHPRAIDIAFADRYSIAVINSTQYLALGNKARLAEGFYNDTLLTNQQACTSPRLIVWLGEDKAVAQAQFWQHFQDYTTKKKLPEAFSVVKNLAHFCEEAAAHRPVKYVPSETCHFFRVDTQKVSVAMLESHPGGGYFYEWSVDDINEIASICSEKCQTMATFGISPQVLEDFINVNRPHGLDRIVPIGETMNFSLYWDGYNLLQALTRTVALSVDV